MCKVCGGDSSSVLDFDIFTVTNAQIAIFANWSWGECSTDRSLAVLSRRLVWLFYRINISNCVIGFHLNTGSTTAAQRTGASVIADATFVNVQYAIQTSTNQPSAYQSGFVLDNAQFTNVSFAGVADINNVIALTGGTKTVPQWVQGSVYSGSSNTYSYVRGPTNAFSKPTSLLESGKIVSRPRPQYEAYDPSQFVSVKALGAKGDGTTDDTAILKSIFATYAGCKASSCEPFWS